MDSHLKAAKILNQTQQRQYPLPSGRWVYYQEWHNVVFLHLRIDARCLKTQVPDFLTIEECDGSPWMSVVAFEVKKLRPRFLPGFKPISSFTEVNIRTYVKHEDKPGVYFLSIKANKRLSCAMARLVSGLPYKYSSFEYTETKLDTDDTSLSFAPGPALNTKDHIDSWLTERYCLYNSEKERNYRYDIHHVEWQVYSLQISDLKFNPEFLREFHAHGAERFHFSPGAQVLTWPSVTI